MELEDKYKDVLIKIHDSENERLELVYVEKHPEIKKELLFLITADYVEFDKTDKAYYLTTEGYDLVEEYKELDATGSSMLEHEFLHQAPESTIDKIIYYAKIGVYLFAIGAIVAAFGISRRAPSTTQLDSKSIEASLSQLRNSIGEQFGMEALKQVNKSWKWSGIVAKKIIKTNDFGNIILKDTLGEYYRIIPEELSINKIASNDGEFNVLLEKEEFQTDWEMTHLLTIARANLGELDDLEKYCFKIPNVIGGEYTIANMGKISFLELISASGDMAFQIKDLEDGTEVELKIIQ